MTARQKENHPAFRFSSENLEKVNAHIAKYPAGRQASAVIPLLDIGQRQNGGWVSQGVIEEIAQILGMPAIRVHEVAAFYTMFNLKPVGKHHIQLCGTTPCWLRGAADLKKACMNRLNIDEGGVSADGKFSLIEVECLGACVNAPVVQINDDFFEDLTPESFVQIIDDLANGKEVKVGSQIGRQCSAPLSSSSDKGLEVKATKAPRKRKVKDAE
ncbi:NADH dehydrogenase [Candidatus Paracaedibacter acanthamoebae]|uniref:NADH dehydrogenase n=1 Tax=Candidatus Odyssella acanthamoebae TaxID=91604 RepID=A0A077AVB1_9PROT|nr:NADH dehydrogenase [Candidatus Paracaedibacter acanthamoebae]